MCELLGVSESGYFAWSRRAPSDRVLTDAWLTERIRAVHAASGGRYGSPRVHAMLAREGIGVGRKRVERLMRAAGLQGAFRRRRKGCTVRVDGVEPFGDLVEPRLSPRRAAICVWAADIKQIKTGEGWLYLAAVQDLFSRRIVGWAMAPHMRQELVVDAREDGRRGAPAAEGDDPSLRSRRAVHQPGLGPGLPSTPGSRSRWAPSGPAMTTPSPRRSSRR